MENECAHCGKYIPNTKLIECNNCHALFCEQCIDTCIECDEACCVSCLDNNKSTCEECRDKED